MFPLLQSLQRILLLLTLQLLLQLLKVSHLIIISNLSIVLDQTKYIYLGPNYQDVFDKMRAKLRNLLHTTVRACVFAKKIPSLEDLRTFLGISYRELKYDLKSAKSFDDVMEILIKHKCTIVNVGCLEVIANHYNIEEAKAQIAAYKSEVNRVCEELKLKICDDFMTGPPSLLKYETIHYSLRWRAKRQVLDDIQELLWKAFKDNAKRIDLSPIRGGIIMIVISIVHMYLSGRQ